MSFFVENGVEKKGEWIVCVRISLAVYVGVFLCVREGEKGKEKELDREREREMGGGRERRREGRFYPCVKVIRCECLLFCVGGKEKEGGTEGKKEKEDDEEKKSWGI